MNSDDIKYLLVKYISNQASEEEAMEVKQWVKQHPENEQYFIELYEAWHNVLTTRPDIIDENKAYDLFAKKINPVKQRRSFFKLFGTTAILLAALLVGTTVFVYLGKPVQPVHQIIAQKGKVEKLILVDGTVVWLNAASTIKYDTGFGKTNRTVYLEGEAFFDVGHPGSDIPFLVKTKNYTIRDIGTRFNLKAYPSDPFFETAVLSGEVSVEDNDTGDKNNNRIHIKPHQVLKINYDPVIGDKPKPATGLAAFNDVHISQLEPGKMDVYAGWKDDLLIFDGNTLGEIAKVFERRYNVKISIAESDIKEIRYSGSFKNVSTIEKVLYIIKQNTPINYAINGDEITITKTTDN